MKKVYIVGNQGNMGRRYDAIVKHLGHYRYGNDKEWLTADHHKGLADYYIVATPTDRHLTDIAILLEYNKPILCEKPLTRNYAELLEFEIKYKDKLHLISMVNQYKFLTDGDSEGQTYYNYYNTGKDGLYWDCINIIGESAKDPSIRNSSPVWICCINGKKLHIQDMDKAYISMIDDWLSVPRSNYEYARRAHEKVSKFSNVRLLLHGPGVNRDTGEKWL